MNLRKPIKLPIDVEYFMSLLSGLESGMATTAAIIAGLTTGTDSREAVVITALITMTVQAYNAAANRLSTEHTQDEIENNKDHTSYLKPTIDAGAQFLAHIISSLIILLPTIYISDLDRALVTTILLTLGLMFTLGFVKGIYVKKYVFRDAMEILLIGASVITVGLLSGYILNSIAG